MKIFKQQTSLKYSNNKFHENIQTTNFMKIFKQQTSLKYSNNKLH